MLNSQDMITATSYIVTSQQKLSDDFASGLSPCWSDILRSQIRCNISEFHHLLVSVPWGKMLHLERRRPCANRSGSCCPLLAGNISYSDEMILNANGNTETHQLRFLPLSLLAAKDTKISIAVILMVWAIHLFFLPSALKPLPNQTQ